MIARLDYETNTITVNPALVAGPVTPSSPTIDSGQSITLTANPSGGTGSYTYQWYYGYCGLSTDMLGTASTQVVSPTSTTYYCYIVKDSSTTPASAFSAPEEVTVNPGL